MNIKQKIQNSNNKKWIIATAILFFIYLAVKFYAWSQTESTDNAYLESDITILSPEVNGVIEQIFFKDNEEVKASQPLAKIKDIDYKTAYEEAVNQVEASKIAITISQHKITMAGIEVNKAEDSTKLAKFNLETSDRELNRINKLTADNFSSKKLYDESKASHQKAYHDNSQSEFSLKLAKQSLILAQNEKIANEYKLKQAQEALERAKNNLERTTINSPINGIITSSSFRLGGFVRTGVPAAFIIPLNNYYIKANFKETQVTKFKQGMKALIEFDSLPGKKFEGKIRSLYPATGSKFSLIPTDNATGNFTKIVQRIPVLIEVTIPIEFKTMLATGASAYVAIRTDQK